MSFPLSGLGLNPSNQEGLLADPSYPWVGLLLENSNTKAPHTVHPVLVKGEIKDQSNIILSPFCTGASSRNGMESRQRSIATWVLQVCTESKFITLHRNH